MNSLIFEVGMLIGLSLNPNLKNSDKQMPFFLIEKTFQSGLYLRNYNESQMQSMKTVQPKTQLEFGYANNGFKIGIGHNEEFQTNSIENFNMSYDYLRISYKVELP